MRKSPSKRVVNCALPRLAACAVLVAAPAALGQRVQYERVAFTGDPAPGTDGAVFAFFSSPQINAKDDVAFIASLAQGAGGVDGTNYHTIWCRRDGELRLVARQGSPAPGTDGGHFDAYVHHLVLNDSGDVAFSPWLVETGVPRGIWRWSGSGSQPIVLNGDPVPGSSQLRFGGVATHFAFNNRGEIAFRGRLELGGDITSDNDLGIWFGDASAMTEVAREGISGHQFSSFHSLLRFSDERVLTFWARMNVDGANDDPGVFFWDGSVHQLTRFGSDATGFPGMTFGYSSIPAVNAAGEIAFSAELVNPAGEFFDSVLYRVKDGVAVPVLRGGDPAPVEGQVFVSDSSNFSRSVINGAGEIAFIGQLERGIGDVTYSNDTGVFIQSGSSLSMPVVRSDPNFTTDFSPWGSEISFNRARDIMINVHRWDGDFYTRAVGVLISNGSDGELFTAVREGEAFDIHPNPVVEKLRVVDWYETGVEAGFESGLEDGLPSSLSETGAVSLIIHFTNGTHGVFIARVADSEPCGPADLDSDGRIRFGDVATFLTALAADDLLADYTGNSQLDYFDVTEFLSLYAEGCP